MRDPDPREVARYVYIVTNSVYGKGGFAASKNGAPGARWPTHVECAEWLVDALATIPHRPHAVTRPRVLIELCAGLAAVSLRLQGGRHARPPVSRMGNKAGYSAVIRRVLGLRPGQGADSYVWCEPDDGARALLQAYPQPAVLREAADIIRGWADEDPRALWERLRAEGPIRGCDGGEVARWLAVQANTLKSGGFDEMTVGGPGDRRPMRMEDLAGRDALNMNGWPPVTITDDARTLDVPADCTGVVVYFDPNYQDTTGYQHGLSRPAVLDLARRWSDAGALVCVSEAVPLEELDMWHHVEITGERVGQKRVFGGTREWLTMNRPPAWTPARQAGLFGGFTAHDTGRGETP